jgi:hypothetical protein
VTPGGWGADLSASTFDKVTDRFYDFLRHRGAHGSTKKAG